MRVHPSFLTVVQGQRQEANRKTTRTDNASVFSLASGISQDSESKDAVEVVSLENKRALAQDPPQDLSAAEAVLTKVKSQLGRLTKNDLAGLHRLDGLVQFYRL